MLRIFALLLIAWGTAASVTARQVEPRYRVGKGRCGPVYMLEDAPEYFANPKTTTEILHVIRVLRAAPPQADVQCHDFTDAWAPYLYANRKVEIARLLLRLKRYDEARDELWSLFLRGGVQYNRQRLYYEFGIKEAVSMLMSDELWDALDVERRLADPRYVYTDQIREAHERRLRSAAGR